MFGDQNGSILGGWWGSIFHLHDMEGGGDDFS